MIRYAICQYYEPFTMGGDVWQWRRFPVESEPVNLVDGFRGFIFLEPDVPEYRVHEKETGGFLGSGTSILEALQEANANIRATLDLRQQMKTLGDTSRYPEVTAAEALRRIRKAKN